MSDELKRHIKNLKEDLRYEVLICELLKNGLIPNDQVRTIPLGIFHRGHSRDLDGFDVIKDSFGEIIYYNFSVWREGLYDAIPEGIFHAPKNREYQKTAGQIKEEVLIQKAEEKAARDFFLPIEQEFYKERIALEMEERDIFAGYSSSSGREIFSEEFWQLELPPISEEQLTSLLHVLPLSFLFKGELKKAETVFRTVLKEQVQIKAVEGQQTAVNPDFFPALGETFLGHNSILAGNVKDEIPSIQTIIGPLGADKMLEYLEGGSQYTVWNTLCEFFLPAEANKILKLEIKEPDCFFSIQDNEFGARLGYTTKLSTY